ncbi:hypothetical protein ACFWUQ_26665 [Streptomyces sp. NPDC058662]|uniref:hypothetical protein n=1 Tax=Streptomyces sp. NPDC058662 TaxID=3346583 RepID=UPI0036562BF4
MNDTAGAPVLDTLFGAITVRRQGQDRIDVQGGAIPPATLRRRTGPPADPAIAIGTRDPALLTLLVDGRPTDLRPAKGRLSRRSYRVEATCDGARYRLVPDSLTTSRLTRGGVHLGDFSCDGDERPGAVWKDGPDIRPADAAIGYVLASAFGTGAQPLWMMLTDAVAEALP